MFFNEVQILVFGMVFWLFWFGDDLLELLKKSNKSDNPYEEISDEDIFELATNSGAAECKSNNDFHEIQCFPKDIYIVKKELEKNIKNFIFTGIEWIPLNNIEISKGKKDELINFFEKLEENDDVQNIYSNEKFLI